VTASEGTCVQTLSVHGILFSLAELV
jgi:hypothetical protein